MFGATMCPSSVETTIYVTLDTCHPVWMTIWYAGWNDSYPNRVTNTKCHIDTVVSPDDEHIVTQNM
jgi:hypothetical protein